MSALPSSRNAVINFEARHADTVVLDDDATPTVGFCNESGDGGVFSVSYDAIAVAPNNALLALVNNSIASLSLVATASPGPVLQSFFNGAGGLLLSPIFSPDSSAIAYLSDAGNSDHVPELWVVDVATFTPRQLATGQVDEFQWSVDSSTILTVDTSGADSKLHTVSVADGSAVDWTTIDSNQAVAANVEAAIFSPDGTHLGFIDDTQAIWVADVRAQTVTNIITSGGEAIAWSADAGRLAFVQSGALIVTTADGAHRNTVTTSLGLVSNVLNGISWSPDGAKIEVLDGNDEEVLIYDANSPMDGPPLIDSLVGSAVVTPPLGLGWSDDSSRFIYIATGSTGASGAYIASLVDGANAEAVLFSDGTSTAWANDTTIFAFAADASLNQANASAVPINAFASQVSGFSALRVVFSNRIALPVQPIGFLPPT